MSVSASPTSGTTPLTVVFSGSAIDPDGFIVSYLWEFGDGQTSSTVSPTYIYRTPGTYTATLTATDNNGLTGRASITVNSRPSSPPIFDIDGDGKSDLAVFRPSEGTWFALKSSDGSFIAIQFGTNGDIPVSADFDGDGKADIVVFRPSNGAWYWLTSSSNFNDFRGEFFGTSGDIPISADFDGDKKSDLAVWRPSNGTWYSLDSSDRRFRAIQFGASEDIPLSRNVNPR